MPLLTIALLTLREAGRRRLVLVVCVLTLVVVGLTGWAFSRFSTLSGSDGRPLGHGDLILTEAQVLILIAYMFSFVLALGAAFLASPAIATDVESGLALAMLPRPMRRSDLVLGKWLGLAALLVVYACLAGALELAVVRVVCGYVPPHAVHALAYLVAQCLVLLTLSLLFSTRLAPVAGGIIALVLFGMSWLAGIAEVLGSSFHNKSIGAAGTALGLLIPSDTFWRGALFSLEPAVVLALGQGVARADPFAVGGPPPVARVIWAVGWMIVVLALAVRSFNRRDL